jgi:hypothetical protein
MQLVRGGTDCDWAAVAENTHIPSLKNCSFINLKSSLGKELNKNWAPNWH